MKSKTQRVQIPRDKNNAVKWDHEVNLGYLSKYSPVRINVVIKQSSSKGDVIIGSSSLRSDDYQDPHQPAKHVYLLLETNDMKYNSELYLQALFIPEEVTRSAF